MGELLILRCPICKVRCVVDLETVYIHITKDQEALIEWWCLICDGDVETEIQLEEPE